MAVLGATVFLLIAAVLGGVLSWWGVLAFPAAVLGGSAFAALRHSRSRSESDASFPVIMRIGVFPLFLFSGTFFPISRLPDWLQPFCGLSPLYHGVELCRSATTGMVDAPRLVADVAFLVACIAGRVLWGVRTLHADVDT